MYTGIVQSACTVTHIESQPGLKTLTISMPSALLEGLELGASVGVDGVCLTVTAFDEREARFDVMHETLRVTTLGSLEVGDSVNVERSAKQGVEIGGHLVSGHVDGVAQITAIDEPENNRFVTYRVPPEKMRYIFHKGFIALNGCSLTVAEVDKSASSFKVCFIPETLRLTTHGNKTLGDQVNFEIDRQTQTIVDTVEQFLKDNHALIQQG